MLISFFDSPPWTLRWPSPATMSRAPPRSGTPAGPPPQRCSRRWKTWRRKARTVKKEPRCFHCTAPPRERKKERSEGPVNESSEVGGANITSNFCCPRPTDRPTHFNPCSSLRISLSPPSSGGFEVVLFARPSIPPPPTYTISPGALYRLFISRNVRTGQNNISSVGRGGVCWDLNTVHFDLLSHPACAAAPCTVALAVEFDGTASLAP